MKQEPVNGVSFLTLPAGVVSALERIATGPRERGGFLVGAGPPWIAFDFVERPNIAREATRFRLEATDLPEIERRLQQDLRVIGVVHSHPASNAVPSQEDQASAWPGAPWLIVGHDGVRVWVRGPIGMREVKWSIGPTRVLPSGSAQEAPQR